MNVEINEIASENNLIIFIIGQYILTNIIYTVKNDILYTFRNYSKSEK